jgi:hypothetical protein
MKRLLLASTIALASVTTANAGNKLPEHVVGHGPLGRVD